MVFKIGQMSRSKHRVPTERSNHKEYSCFSTVITWVEVLKKYVQLQGQGSIIKINGTHGEFLSHKILSWNIKALNIYCYKQGQSFQKVGRTPSSRSQGQNCWY